MVSFYLSFQFFKINWVTVYNFSEKMADQQHQDDSLYPIAVLIDELRNEDVQVLSDVK